MNHKRRQHVGLDEVEAAIESRLPLRVALVRRDLEDPRLARCCERLEELGVRLRRTSSNDVHRMSGKTPAPDILAMSGPDPAASPQEWLLGAGPAWLLIGVRFPGNAGFAIRSAEVSGAVGVFLDVEYDGSQRRKALRASMYADRYLPVAWYSADEAIALARTAGRSIIALEDTGEQSPWKLDMSQPSLFVIGGEEQGVPASVQAQCDRIVRIPMHGFIPSYNLQAAMSIVTGEFLRQREATA